MAEMCKFQANGAWLATQMKGRDIPVFLHIQWLRNKAASDRQNASSAEMNGAAQVPSLKCLDVTFNLLFDSVTQNE